MCAEVSHKTLLWLDPEQSVRQTNTRLHMPESWQSATGQQFFEFYDDDRGESVKDDVEESSLRRRIQLRADYCMPADRDRFYFEIEFVTVGPDCIIGNPGSWGYHGDDGMKYDQNGEQGILYGPKYGAGDIIGCGVNFITNSVFFTKNGQYLGTEQSITNLQHPANISL
ncbi:hypothetical protein H2198_001556 [Neophaeococcomyces mojaviensis]|uniref:Uncharacterized protein n=1 Tax=Neophaeococcomyces mojaviensis TaxID=3383035 RepID=A0ACC3AHC4_9EURO|nr:hypothetical protein H2198_001556 [Knufia sp. JES_112]